MQKCLIKTSIGNSPPWLLLHEFMTLPKLPEPEFVNLPRIRFPAWRADTATLFDVPAFKATYASGIDSLESIPGLLKR
jgi:hypothetical protein